MNISRGNRSETNFTGASMPGLLPLRAGTARFQRAIKAILR
jgi:hypothetical protein